MKTDYKSALFFMGSLLLGGNLWFPSAVQAAPRPWHARLEHMNYFPARKIILNHGWRPVPGRCQQASAKECKRFPEIIVCQNVAPGYCEMVFVKKNRCLYISTIGGEPEKADESDAHVDYVNFRSTPCSKN